MGEEGSACELNLSDSYSCATIEFEADDDEEESQYAHPDHWWKQKMPEWQMEETQKNTSRPQKKSVRSFSEDGALLFSDDYIKQAVAEEEEEKEKQEAEAAKQAELKKNRMEYEFHNYGPPPGPWSPGRPRRFLCDSDEEREKRFQGRDRDGELSRCREESP